MSDYHDENIPILNPSQRFGSNPKKKKQIKTQPPNWRLLAAVCIICCILYWWFVLKKDGYYEDYGNYGDCSKVCKDGSKKTRTRKYVPAQWGGKNIPEKERQLEDSADCTHLEPCIDGKMSEWSEWSKCTSKFTTVDGERSRTREYEPAGPGGKDLSIEAQNKVKETETCQGTEIRDTIDGFFSDWTDIDGICRKEKNEKSVIQPCKDGHKQQKRVYTPPLPGGKDLTNKNDLTQWIPCDGAKATETKDGYCDDWQFIKCVNSIAQFERKYNNKQECGNDVKCKDNLKTSNPDESKPEKIFYCESLKDITPSSYKCNPEFGSNIKKKIIKEYILPTKDKKYMVNPQQSNDPLIKNIPTKDMENLYNLSEGSSTTIKININGSENEYNFTRNKTEDPNKTILKIEYYEKCDDKLHSEEDIKKIWKSICYKDLPDPIDDKDLLDIYNPNNQPIKIKTLRGEPSLPDIRQKIEDLYRIENLIKKQKQSNDFTKFIDSINECYPYANMKILTPTDFTNFINNSSVKSDFRTDILYPGICYKGEYKITSPNGNFILVCGGKRYNLALYHKDYSNKPIWSIPLESGDSGNNNICMEADGDFVIWKDGTTSGITNLLWRSGTHTTDHKSRNAKGSYCQLLDNGLFVIKNKDGYINLSGKMEQVISDIGRGYYNLTKKYLQFKGGDEKYFKDSSKIYQYFSYSNDFTWKNDDLVLQIWSDGDLTIKKKSTNIWKYSLKESDWKKNSTLTMQADGNLVLDDPDGNSIYSSKTNGNGPGTYAELHNSNLWHGKRSPYKGHVIIRNTSNNVVGTLSKYDMNNVEKYYEYIHFKEYPYLQQGDEFLLKDKDTIYPLLRYHKDFEFRSKTNDDGTYYTLRMKNNGNLILYYKKPGVDETSICTSGTSGNNNAVLTFQENTRLAIDRADLGKELRSIFKKDEWGYVNVQGDGNVVLYRNSDRKVLWKTGSTNETTWWNGAGCL